MSLMTTSERIGDICANEREEEVRKLEEKLEQAKGNTASAAQPNRIVAPKHAELRTDLNHEYVKLARLTCKDADDKKVTFKIVFTATLKLGEQGESQWN